MSEALEGASSLQLYQLRALIDGMLAEPKRIMRACAELHLGQAVRFVDFQLLHQDGHPLPVEPARHPAGT